MIYRTHTAVIGAGASGLMAGGFSAQNGVKTMIFEKNALAARKLLITGKGRCNVTNHCDADHIIKNVKVNGRFLYSAVNQFPPQKTMEFFEKQDVPLKTERGNRVFPVSDHAEDIVKALLGFVRREKVEIITGSVKKLNITVDRVTGFELENGDQVEAKKVIVATGGLSYPGTGSTGDGYRFARQAGHTIMDPQPSLIPIETKEDWCKDAMGLSLKNVVLSVTDQQKEKVIFSELGEMLFTHFGVSGPLVLSASSHMDSRRLPQYILHIDLKPGLSLQQLDARFQRDFQKFINRDFINSLTELYPRKLIPVVCRLSGIEPERKVNQITREERQRVIELTKALPLTVKRFRPIGEAIITSGGVCVKEVNPKTMESKLCRGLYFAGEVLDVDAYTGGYNLQIAFSTGYAAAQSNLEEV